jgi:hypothetical protein
MENIIYWTVSEAAKGEDDDKDNLLVYIIAHQDDAAREASWQAFLNDPEWKRAAAKSEENGKILAKAPRSILMRATDFSATDEPPNRDSNATPRLFELRQYNDGPDQLPSTVARFAAGEKDIFTKHGMQTVSFWTATNQSALIYLLAHKDREASRQSWSGFFPDFREFMREHSERNPRPQDSAAPGGQTPSPRSHEVRFLVPTDYSPRK